MSLTLSGKAVELPTLNIDLSFGSISRNELKEYLLQYFTQLIRESGISPQDFETDETGDIDPAHWAGIQSLRSEIERIQNELLKLIASQAGFSDMAKFPAGSTLDHFTRSLISQAFESALLAQEA